MNAIPDYETAAERLPPAEYRKLLPHVSLGGLTLEKLATEVQRDLAREAEGFTLKMERQDWQFVLEDEAHPELVATYVVQGLAGRKQAIKIAATYRLQMLSEEELPVEFWVIYGNSSADMQVWPFFRELAHALTSRMEVPRLTLPLLVNPAVLTKRKPRVAGANKDAK